MTVAQLSPSSASKQSSAIPDTGKLYQKVPASLLRYYAWRRWLTSAAIPTLPVGRSSKMRHLVRGPETNHELPPVDQGRPCRVVGCRITGAYRNCMDGTRQTPQIPTRRVECRESAHRRRSACGLGLRDGLSTSGKYPWHFGRSAADALLLLLRRETQPGRAGPFFVRPFQRYSSAPQHSHDGCATSVHEIPRWSAALSRRLRSAEGETALRRTAT
jgi:hypothetical protein